ncbi:MAG: polysaccharide deacetylase family protein [Bacteroidaceae bacterium]|nr:polysaccharide deacetylase family protein [Candidatus Equimonas faecalis]MCQ2205703.1 polysaccharide deacetylase family protein [Bacteroidaceae bacterium]
MFIEQPARLMRYLYPHALWRPTPAERVVYLTFDDGPIPEVTPFVLEVLRRYDVKATFFMVGENCVKHPDEFAAVRAEGHRLGNHTYNHWGSVKHSAFSYIRNIEKANEILHTDLFRPPHGLMFHSHYALVKRHGYRVVMWDVVTRDYSTQLNGQDVLLNVRRLARPGSIITFHDSLKSFDKILYALPRSIEFLQRGGYTFRML